MYTETFLKKGKCRPVSQVCFSHTNVGPNGFMPTPADTVSLVFMFIS